MTFSNTSEIHISGRIDNFLFGAIKDPYFQEFQNSDQVFKDSSKTKQNFLESFFSIFYFFKLLKFFWSFHFPPANLLLPDKP